MQRDRIVYGLARTGHMVYLRMAFRPRRKCVDGVYTNYQPSFSSNKRGFCVEWYMIIYFPRFLSRFRPYPNPGSGSRDPSQTQSRALARSGPDSISATRDADSDRTRCCGGQARSMQAARGDWGDAIHVFETNTTYRLRFI